MVDFKSIETFLWVVNLGSFRGAGQRLNTTQPAISQRIAQLERELGVKLLNRDHRVATPTPSGRSDRARSSRPASSALSAASRDRQALERLKERRLADHHREMARLEDQTLGEIAINGFRRRAA